MSIVKAEQIVIKAHFMDVPALYNRIIKTATAFAPVLKVAAPLRAFPRPRRSKIIHTTIIIFVAADDFRKLRHKEIYFLWLHSSHPVFAFGTGRPFRPPVTVWRVFRHSRALTVPLELTGRLSPAFSAASRPASKAASSATLFSISAPFVKFNWS